MNGEFYPGKSGNLNNIGVDKGKYYNLNFPLSPEHNDQHVGDQEYLYIYTRYIEPVLQSFKPEMVLISAGFDCML